LALAVQTDAVGCATLSSTMTGTSLTHHHPPRTLPTPASAPFVGLAIGALTSVGQTYLGGPVNALVNSASMWLIAPLLIGRTARTRGGAATAGLVVALSQLLGYYLTAHLRGFGVGGGMVAIWTACAIVGGPLFGAAGHLWRSGDPRLRGAGATALPAIFLAEGLWIYWYELGYLATTALWLGIGTALAVFLPAGPAQRRWLPATLTIGIAGEIALTHIARYVA
jgi:hypothetical protein